MSAEANTKDNKEATVVVTSVFVVVAAAISGVFAYLKGLKSKKINNKENTE